MVNSRLAHSGGLVVLDSGLVAFVVSEADQGATDFNGDGDATDLVPHVLHPATGMSANTGLASGGFVVAAGDRVAFPVSEAMHGGMDLNADGDALDDVVHVFDPATEVTVGSGLAFASSLDVVGDRVAFLVPESDQDGTDLNGDGDAFDPVLHVFDPVAGISANSGLAGLVAEAVGDRVAIDVHEGLQGMRDLNGDSDTADTVVHVFDPATGTSANSGLAWAGGLFVAVGDRVAFEVSEADQGLRDLNGDTDTADTVVHVFDPVTGMSTSSGLAAGFSGVSAVGGRAAFTVPEAGHGAGDLNGDGDALDEVVHVFDPTTGMGANTGLAAGGFRLAAVGGRVAFDVPEPDQGIGDLNGDGDTTDSVVHVFDPGTGSVANTRLALGGFSLAALGDRVAFAVSEGSQGTDLNGDTDTNDDVLHVFDPAMAAATNSGLAVDVFAPVRAAGDQVMVGVREAGQGADLNGDTDSTDVVAYVFDPIEAAARNLELAVDSAFPVLSATGRVAAVSVPEASQGGADLNGDGDALDTVLHAVTLNTAPRTAPDSATVEEGGGVVVNGLLDNDTDREGDAMTAIKTSDPAHGSVSLEPDGSYLYIHDGSETTLDSFTYAASDGLLQSDPTAVTITVIPVNDRPVAVPDEYMVAEGAMLSVNGVLDNDRDPEGTPLSAVKVADPAHGKLALEPDGSFTYVHDGSDTAWDSFTYRASDGAALSNTATVTLVIMEEGHTAGLVDPAQGKWYLRNSVGQVTSFFYGNPGDIPFMGDWDCDGDDTPGLFRQSDAFAYLRNNNSVGIADIRFFFGNPSDVPLAGDFDGNGCDTLSIYRPSEQRFYIINRLGENEGGLGQADFFFTFGNPGDKPVVGDWDDDGIDEVGLHRESTGFFYWRETLTTGVADGEIFFGDPGDRFVAGDWGIVDGADTPAVFRPSRATFFVRHTLTQGIADSQFPFGEGPWLPVAGEFGLG